MKKIHLILIFTLLSLSGFGQSFLNMGNTLQRRIIGTDTVYRFNLGSPGFWYPKIGGGSSYTFNNGLTETSGVVGLGGDGVWNYTSQARIGGIGKGTLNLTTTSVNLSSPITNGSGSYQVQSNGLFTNIQVNSKISSIEILNNRFTVRDSVNSEGMKYAQKYRLNLTNRSIMDKEYIDSVAAASGGGYTLPIASGSVLGGIKVGSGLSIDGTGVLSTIGGSAPDTTIYRTVSNSFSKAQTNTQISNAIAAYTPPSQVDNDLSASTTRAPSKTAVNTALGLKADDANVVHKTGNETIGGVKTFSNSPVVGTSTANTTINANSIYFNQSGGNFISLQPPTLTGIRLQNFQDDDGQIALTKNITKAAVGLSNVDNTSDANKPVSTAQQTALDGKQNTLVSGTNIKTINGNSVLGSGDLVIGGSSYTAGYGIGIASNVISADTTSTNGLVSKSRLTASLQNFNVSADFTGTGTVASPFSLATPISASKGGAGTNNGILKANGSGVVSAAVSGTDYVIPSGSITGSAASLTTSRNLWGVGFNGTANVTAKPTFTAGTTASASINIAQGVAPTTPANGDIWNTSTVQQHRIGGVTKTVAYTTDLTTPNLNQVTTVGSTTANGVQVGSIGVNTSIMFPLVHKAQIKTGTDNNLLVGIQGSEVSLESTNDAVNAARPLRIYSSKTMLNLDGGNVLIGTSTDNGAKLQVNGTTTTNNITVQSAVNSATVSTSSLITSGSDVEVLDATKGIILKSPNGTRWRITISNTGVLTTTAL